MLFAIAITVLAQPAGPPFQYDLTSTAFDADDDYDLQTGLTAVRILSSVAAGQLDRSVVTTLSAMIDARGTAALPSLGTDIDQREDLMIQGAYMSVLKEYRSDAEYLHCVEPIRIQMRAWLTEMLQQSLTCRTAAKAGGDATACEAAIASYLDQFVASFVPWIQGSASYWASQGNLIDSDTALIANMLTQKLVSGVP